MKEGVLVAKEPGFMNKKREIIAKRRGEGKGGVVGEDEVIGEGEFVEGWGEGGKSCKIEKRGVVEGDRGFGFFGGRDFNGGVGIGGGGRERDGEVGRNISILV